MVVGAAYGCETSSAIGYIKLDWQNRMAVVCDQTFE